MLELPILGNTGWGPVNNEALLELDSRTSDLQAAGTPQWIDGTGAPSSALGKTGDWYLDDATGDLYKKLDAITWQYRVTIRGAKGDQGEPGLPGPTAVPTDDAIGTLVGTDGTHAANAVDARILAQLAAGVFDSYKHPMSHAATGDGATDDKTALQATLDAASAGVGGTMLIDRVYGWKGVLSVPDNVAVIAVGGGTLKALDNTARLQAGSMSGGHTRPGPISGLTVDGNSTGDPTGLVWIESVRNTYSNVTITGAGGKGMVVNGAQNNTFVSVDVLLCGDDSVTYTHGAGGNLHLRCEMHGTASRALVSTEADAGVYPYAPTHNTFKHCIFETAVNGISLVDIEAGAMAKFDDCAFSQDGTAALSSGYIFRILNNPYNAAIVNVVQMVDPFFYGGSAGHQVDAIYVKNFHTLSVSGRGYFQNTPNVYSFDGTPTLALHGTADYYGITNVFNQLTGGALNTVGPIYDAPIGVKVRPGPQAAFRAGRSTDNGWRIWINPDGGLTWGDGTTYVPVGPSVGRDATNSNLVITGGLKVTGRRGHTSLAHNISTNGQTTACDVKAYSVHLFSLFANAGAVTLTNGVLDDEVTLIVAQDATGGRAFPWPTALYQNGNTPPSDTTANLITTVVLRCNGTSWYETGRSGAGVPGPPGPAGPANDLEIGTVTTGAAGTAAAAAITGASPSQTLNLTIPRGDKGDQGDTGDAGPANTLAIGTVTTGTPGTAASASITGTPPSQTLNLTIPRGDTGDTGSGGVTSVNGNSGAVTVEPVVAAGTTSQYYRGDKSWATLDKAAVGLSNVPNVDTTNASNITSGTLPSSVMPPLAISDVFTVASQAAMLALTAQRGDVAVRTDTNQTFILSTDSPSTLGDWKQILTPVDGVTSVNGSSGPSVVLAAADVGAQPSNAQLTAIAGLAPANDDFLQRKAGAWTNRTIAQVKTDLGVAGPAAPNTQAASYTLALADAEKRVESSSAAPVTFTVPTNASIAFPIGTRIEIGQYGAGQVTVAPASGVTLRYASSATTRAQYSVVTLFKRATDEWVISGDAT